MNLHSTLIKGFCGTVPVALVALALNANAGVDTSRTSFESYVTSHTPTPATDNFQSYAIGNDPDSNPGTANGITVTAGSDGSSGFTYNIDANPTSLNNLFVEQSGGGNNVANALGGGADSNLIITFSGVNVQSAGFELLLTDSGAPYNRLAGTMAVDVYLNGSGTPDGALSVTGVSSATTGVVSYRGFSIGTPGDYISQIVIKTATASAFNAMDNLTVGLVPEAPTWIGALFIGLLIGGKLVSSRVRKPKAA